MYKSILVPVDIEEDILTQNALRHVEYLAKMSDADVHFLYVLPDAQAFVTAYSFGIKEFENKAVTYAEERIRELIQGVDLPAERMSYTIRLVPRVMRHCSRLMKWGLTLSLLVRTAQA